MKKLKLAISRFGNDYIGVGSNSPEVRFQCPQCKELGKTYDDYKLYVNCDSGKYWCHRCQLTGTLGGDSKLYSSSTDVYSILNKLLETEEKTSLFKLPKNLASGLAESYLNSRGISSVDIRYYSIRSEPLHVNTKLSGRVVIPNKIIDMDYTDMFTARSYIGHKLRYYNPYNSASKVTVFNLHRIIDSPSRIIINEGPINSIIAGRNSVATYGKYVSNEKLYQIINKNPKQIIISLDRDAIDISYKLADRIKKLKPSIEVKIVELPFEEDAASLGKSNYLSYVENKSLLYNNTITWQINNALKFIKGEL